MIEALGADGVEAGSIEGLTGVWTVGAAARRRAADPDDREARKIGSIGVHVSRGVTTHGFAINVNNDLQPFEWIVPCGIEGCRMTSVCRELGAEQDMGALHGRRQPSASARSTSASRSRSSRMSCASGAATAEPRYLRRRMPPDRRDADRGAPPRHPLAREPGRHGSRTARARSPSASASRRWLKVPAPGGPTYRRLKKTIAERQPPHRLRGGQLPQRRRVLGARHRDLHDPRRRLHPPLRLLQRADGQADLERPAGAAARRQPGEEDGPAPRGGHLGRPRRPARLRRQRLRRRDPLDPHAWRPAARSRC